MSEDVHLRYGRTARLFHWTIAALIIANLLLGFVGARAGETLHRILIDNHKAIGIIILALSAARLAWRLLHKAPPPLSTLHPFERAASAVVHWAFYLLMILVPLVGWWLSSAVPQRHAIELFGIATAPFLPVSQSWPVAGRLHAAHAVLALSMAALLAIHIAAVLKHRFWDRDGTLDRMAPRWRGPEPDPFLT